MDRSRKTYARTRPKAKTNSFVSESPHGRPPGKQRATPLHDLSVPIRQCICFSWWYHKLNLHFHLLTMQLPLM